MNAGSERPAASAVVYREQLRVPVWWYAVGVFVAALLAAEFRIAGIDLTAWLPFAVLLTLEDPEGRAPVFQEFRQQLGPGLARRCSEDHQIAAANGRGSS